MNRFLALGDSYTIGEGVNDADRWPMQLAQRLRADGIPVADPEIIARTGWTTDELDAMLATTAKLWADPEAKWRTIAAAMNRRNP